MFNQIPSMQMKVAVLVTLALCVVIAYLTLVPTVSEALVPGSDKTHHFLAFFALALPLSFARPRLAPWIILGAMAYGGAIELIQPYVGRDRDIYDFLADTAGAVSGAAVGVSLSWLRVRLA